MRVRSLFDIDRSFAVLQTLIKTFSAPCQYLEMDYEHDQNSNNNKAYPRRNAAATLLAISNLFSGRSCRYVDVGRVSALFIYKLVIRYLHHTYYIMLGCLDLCSSLTHKPNALEPIPRAWRRRIDAGRASRRRETGRGEHS